MKNLLIPIILAHSFFLFTSHGFAQSNYIIAGVYDSNDYFYDIIPDTVILENYGSSSYYHMDFDGDSITDLWFVSYRNWAAFWGEEGVNVATPNVEISGYDPGFIHVCNMYDTIRNDTAWIGNISRKVNYHTWQFCPPMCPGYDNYYNDTLHDKYLGFRYYKQSDTLYGWIKFSTAGGNRITIQEWAVNKLNSTTVIESPELPPVSSIIPDPFSSFAVIKFNRPLNNATLFVYDLQGRKVKLLHNISGNQAGLNRGNLCPGLYFYFINEYDRTITRGKFLIAD